VFGFIYQRYKPESCVLGLTWRKIHIKAIDAISDMKQKKAKAVLRLVSN